jgi:hypothetical protein
MPKSSGSWLISHKDIPSTSETTSEINTLLSSKHLGIGLHECQKTDDNQLVSALDSNNAIHLGFVGGRDMRAILTNNEIDVKKYLSFTYALHDPATETFKIRYRLDLLSPEVLDLFKRMDELNAAYKTLDDIETLPLQHLLEALLVKITEQQAPMFALLDANDGLSPKTTSLEDQAQTSITEFAANEIESLNRALTLMTACEKLKIELLRDAEKTFFSRYFDKKYNIKVFKAMEAVKANFLEQPIEIEKALNALTQFKSLVRQDMLEKKDIAILGFTIIATSSAILLGGLYTLQLAGGPEFVEGLKLLVDFISNPAMSWVIGIAILAVAAGLLVAAGAYLSHAKEARFREEITAPLIDAAASFIRSLEDAHLEEPPHTPYNAYDLVNIIGLIKDEDQLSLANRLYHQHPKLMLLNNVFTKIADLHAQHRDVNLNETFLLDFLQLTPDELQEVNNKLDTVDSSTMVNEEYFSTLVKKPESNPVAKEGFFRSSTPEPSSEVKPDQPKRRNSI